MLKYNGKRESIHGCIGYCPSSLHKVNGSSRKKNKGVKSRGQSVSVTSQVVDGSNSATRARLRRSRQQGGRSRPVIEGQAAVVIVVFNAQDGTDI